MARHLLLALAFACITAGCQAHFVNFTLPNLPYSTSVFEPNIDNTTMYLHWFKHTQTYATKLNDAILTTCLGQGLALTPLSQLVQKVGATVPCGSNRCKAIRNTDCETAIRHQAGGLYNHGLFFLHTLAPTGIQNYNVKASNALRKAITSAFGSLDNFKANFTTAATGVFGSGWTWLVYTPATRKLSITTTPNQDNPIMGLYSPKSYPILGLDVWEHAYYLKYQNKRADYVAAFLGGNIINWAGVSNLYDKAVTGKYPSLNVLDLNQTTWVA
ncbi:hypothetical protein ABPG77_006269 [Micractinium sp. CCAP 211/92]